MPPPERLRSSRDIQAVIRSGWTVHTPAAVVHARRRATAGRARATVAAGRRVGRAVARNRAKRRLRAALGLVDLPPGLDVVVLARPGAVSEPFPDLVNALRTALERLTSP
jgi:ribonuclease P protein component